MIHTNGGGKNTNEGPYLECRGEASVVSACRLWRTGSVDVARGLSCPAACGAVIEPVTLSLAGGFLTTGPPGSDSTVL